MVGNVLLAARILIALVFVASAVSKLRGVAAFQSFETATRGMGVPARLVRPAAIAVLAGEVLTVPLLALPPGGLAGFAVAAVLLVAFSVGIALAVRRGTRQSCNCFGSSTTPMGVRHLVRNGFLLAVVAAGVAGAVTGAAAPSHPAAIAIVAVAAAVGALLVIRYDDLAALFVPDRPAASRSTVSPRVGRP
ncbi:MauE/DoxX family redox-associated membrane protein [Plantactinospora sp. GCM10030261]|uniref:MauE/DoxX family redox-associated membrane protein n=1 Tax=Plantactinospora sp. GCM10030261 TaxID=3273420 RepID=UPI003609E5C9